MIFDWIKNLLAVRYLSFKNGEIRLDKERMLFVNLFPLIETFRINKMLSERTYPLSLYLAFKQSGYDFTHTHTAKFGKDINEMAILNANMLYTIGWGSFEFIKTDATKDLTFLMMRSKNSAFADEIKNKYGAQEDPVDYMVCGLFAGALQAFTKDTINCFEITCRVQKDCGSCQYVAATDDNIIKYLEGFADKDIPRAKGFLEEIKNLEGQLGITYAKTKLQ